MPVLDRNSILIDTDVCSFIHRGDSRARYYLSHLVGKQVAISFITLAQALYGAYKDNWSPVNLESLNMYLADYTLLPFEPGLCSRFAELKCQVEKKGYVISDSDCWIAACALYYNCILATNNRKHFEYVGGLSLL